MKRDIVLKWVGLDNTFLSLIQRAIVAFTMIGAAIIGIVNTVAGVEESPTLSFIAGGLAAFSALKEPLSKLIIADFTTTKLKECLSLDELYLSYLGLQAYKDGKITVEEVVKYQALITAIEQQLCNI